MRGDWFAEAEDGGANGVGGLEGDGLEDMPEFCGSVGGGVPGCMVLGSVGCVACGAGTCVFEGEAAGFCSVPVPAGEEGVCASETAESKAILMSAKADFMNDSPSISDR
jgi:hypothetical protein